MVGWLASLLADSLAALGAWSVAGLAGGLDGHIWLAGLSGCLTVGLASWLAAGSQLLAWLLGSLLGSTSFVGRCVSHDPLRHRIRSSSRKVQLQTILHREGKSDG